MIDVLKSIQEQIMALPASEGSELPLIKYVDEDWGQLTDFGANCPVKWPCCLIDVQSASYSDMGPQRGAKPLNRQQGTETIVLTIANLKLANSSGKAPLAQKEKAWLIETLKERVHEVIHGWAPVPGHGKLMRVGSKKVTRDDGIQQHQVTYTIGLHNV